METDKVYDSSKQKLRHYKELFHLPGSVTLDHLEQLFYSVPCWLECSHKIKSDLTYSQRLNLWFFRAEPDIFNHISGFFEALGKTYDLNFSLLEKLIKNIDFKKINQFIVGVDLREEPVDSRVKLWLIVEDYPDKVAECVEVNGSDQSVRDLVKHSSNIFLFGFDYSLLDYKSRIKIYPLYFEDQIRENNVKELFSRLFCPETRRLIDQCKRVHVSFQGRDFQKIIHFTPRLPDAFIQQLNHPTVNEISAKYRSRGYPPSIISLADKQLAAARLEDINLYF